MKPEAHTYSVRRSVGSSQSLLETVLIQEEWQAARQQAVREIHKVWCEENDNPTEAEGLEIVRLGLLANEQEIAVSVGHRITRYWVNNSRFVEALELCKQVLAVFQDYRILGTVARAEEVLGFVQEAVTHYQQVLDLCPEEELQEKATTLNNMALVIAQQGDIPKAIALYEQNLEICEQIGDVKLKAATLNYMAQVFAQQGDILKAIALWEQNLEICEQIGDVKLKATTLSNMAQVFAQQGDIPKAIALWEQVVSAFAQISAYGNLVTVLGNLGVTDESNGLVYLAQAIWLTLRIQAPLVDTIQLIRVLYNKVPQGDELEAALGATAMFFCNSRGEGHPQLEELQEDSFKIISGAANTQGIETQEAFDNWFVQQRLNDPEYFLPRLNQRLEEIVGDGWLFDRSQVVGG
jgi:tetratricopeptide (TPR) repeat protein